jgi:hypothetical protein
VESAPTPFDDSGRATEVDWPHPTPFEDSGRATQTRDFDKTILGSVLL